MLFQQLTYWFSHLTQHSPFLFAVLDKNHRYIWTSQRYSEISGLKQQELVGKHDSEILGSVFYNALEPYYQQALQGESCEGETVLCEHELNSSFHFSVYPLKYDDQQQDVIIFHAADTSERQILSNALISSENRFKSLCKLVGQGCCVIDNGIIMTANSHAVTMLGFDNINEILGEHIDALLTTPNVDSHLFHRICDLKSGEQLICQPKNISNGKMLAISYSPANLFGGKSGIIAFSKAHSSPFHRHKVERLAQFDALTGLYNRHGFSRRLEQLIRTQTPLLMLYLDVDNFKNINDSLGHHIGDRVLQDIAQRLRRQLPTDTLLGHFGGDEFAVLLPEQNSPEIAQELTDKIISLINQPFDLYHFKKYLACSIGLVKYPDDGKDARSLLQNADTAMYEAKEQGRNKVVSYHHHMNKEARMRLWLEIELQKALQNNSFEIWYQPQVNSKNNKINGAEALLRWKHPVEGYISPARFIPIAERSDMIEQLGRNVMREVFQNVHRWQNMNILQGKIAINLSAQQFKNPNISAHMEKLLEETHVSSSSLTFELTESTVMQNTNLAIQMFNSIKSLGFSLSIDDFGTGYSSLAYLAKFPIDELKIDRTFITEMVNHPRQITLIENIINLAKALQLDVVAEGVETAQQAAILNKLNCDTIQGYYFYKPMPRIEFERLLIQEYKKNAVSYTHH